MKRLLLYLIPFLFLVSCGSIETTNDYDENINFKQYRSFSFYEDMDTGLNQLEEKRFSRALDSTLQIKGFTHAEKADLKINYYGEFYQQISRNNLNIGIGTYGANVGGNVASGIPIDSKKNKLSLTVEIIDAQKNQLIWQGVVDTKYNAKATAEKRSALFQKLAEKVLESFPPEK